MQAPAQAEMAAAEQAASTTLTTTTGATKMARTNAADGEAVSVYLEAREDFYETGTCMTE